MLSVGDATGRRTALHALVWTAALAAFSALPGSPFYRVAALALGAGFLAVAMLFAWERSRLNAQRMLLASIGYLPLLLTLLVLEAA